MNFIFPKREQVLAVSDDEESNDSQGSFDFNNTAEANADKDKIDVFIDQNDFDELDLTSSKHHVAKKTKRAFMKYIEDVLNQKQMEGLSNEEILRAIAEKLSTGGVTEDGEGGTLNVRAIQNYINEKKEKLALLKMIEQRKEILRKHREEEENLLESVKKRADSTFIDDRYVPRSNHVDKTDYSSPEFTTLQYTPVACKGPAEFVSDGYKIRTLRESGRKPRLMVVITMYNEPPEQLQATLRSVGKNILEMQNREQRFDGWGLEVWRDVCVCIVSDGRTKVLPETLDWLERHGMYSEEMMQYKVESTNQAKEAVYKETTMHLFERTVLLDKNVKNRRIRVPVGQKQADGNRGSTSRFRKSRVKGVPQDMRHLEEGGRSGKKQSKEKVIALPPMQLMFALKEKNAQKLNSHFWFFEAFCKEVNPDFCIMLDVGTMPTHNAFTLLLTEMATNRNVAGTCGEITVDEPFSNPFNWVKLAQHFEYKVSNFLDKACESAFGYISVLPGAFSAYRFKQIQGAPLQKYFAPLTHDIEDLGPFKGNMYLAEDRILCIEILAKKNEHLLMSYVKDARARTDVPDTLKALILQRRRWINGSFFASYYALANYYRVFSESSHDSARKLALFLLFLYQVLVFISSWFQIALFILTIYFVAIDGVQDGNIPFVDGSQVPLEVYAVFMLVYGCMLIAQLVIALGNKLQYVSSWYTALSVWYGLIMTTVLSFTFLIFVFVDPTEIGGTFVVISAALSLGVIFVAALLHGELHHIVFTTVQYLVLLPVLVNVLTMYSMSNLHDLSWGTKGLQEVTLKDNKVKVKRMRENLGAKYQNLDPRDVEYLNQQFTDREVAKINDKREKRFTNFRTYMLLAYLLSQVGAIFACISFVDSNDYFTFFALFVGGINSFKFAGSLYFLVNTHFKRIRVWFFVKFGWTMCLCCNAEEMLRRSDLIASEDEKRAKDQIFQIDALFHGGGDNLLYVKEAQDDKVSVRESAVYDRAFYGRKV